MRVDRHRIAAREIHGRKRNATDAFADGPGRNARDIAAASIVNIASRIDRDTRRLINPGD